MHSDFILARLDSKDMAMFRFLLESYENIALFTVLEKRPALIKIIFARESREDVLRVLNNISSSLSLLIEDRPF